MINIKLIRNNIDLVKSGLKKRNFNLDKIDEIKQLDQQILELSQEIEELSALRNKLSDEVKKSINKEENISKVKDINSKITEININLIDKKEKLTQMIYLVPNMLDNDVKEGKDENDNEIISENLKFKKEYKFTPLRHEEIIEKNNYGDFKRAVKLASSRFFVSRETLSKLERALVNFMLDEHTKKGYEEIKTPILVNEQTLYGSGNFPKFKEDVFKVENQNLYLIPTGESPLVNLYANEIINKDELPIKLTTYSPCFRSEVGSAGKDRKGLIRMHQFEKVELVQIVDPKESKKQLDIIVKDAASILDKLELPYRIIRLCSGDTGFTSSETFDIEVWMPGSNEYREISSCSNTKDFQSRRNKLRYKKDKETIYPHLLNGSALAIGRTVAAIIENNQNSDGSFNIPKILEKYY